MFPPDIHRDDPLEGMHATAGGAAALARVVLDLAEELCGGRLLLVLEGGYNLVALRESVDAVLDEMDGRTLTRPAPAGESEVTRRQIDRAREPHAPVWRSLAR